MENEKNYKINEGKLRKCSYFAHSRVRGWVFGPVCSDFEARPNSIKATVSLR